MSRQQSAIKRQTNQVGACCSVTLPPLFCLFLCPEHSDNEDISVLQMCCACSTMQLHTTQRRVALAWLPSSSG